jgi:hypothetical protein
MKSEIELLRQRLFNLAMDFHRSSRTCNQYFERCCHPTCTKNRIALDIRGFIINEEIFKYTPTYGDENDVELKELEEYWNEKKQYKLNLENKNDL